jgi:hypothetical protein
VNVLIAAVTVAVLVAVGGDELDAIAGAAVDVIIVVVESIKTSFVCSEAVF